MLRRSLSIALAASTLVACSQSGGKSGPAVAKGNGIVITADEFKARLEEQSPFIRARYSTLERKKEFLDNLVRMEVLAKEAERQGLDKDPDVQATLRKIMVQKLVQKTFGDQAGAKDVPEADEQKYYDEHKEEFQKPKRVRVSAILWNAAAGSAESGKKLTAARKLAGQIRAEEKTNSLAFATAVAKTSEDAPTKAAGGDLGFKTRDDLEKAYGKELAEAVFSLKSGEMAGPLGVSQGVALVKVTGIQEELNRPFDQVKQQIGTRLFREKRTKEFDELVKKLKEQAKIEINDKELEAVAVAAPPAPGMGGMPGMPGAAALPPGVSVHGAPGAPPPQAAPAR